MSKTILIIEDDDFLQALMSKKLHKENYTVLVASKGGDALDIINKKEKIDLFLVDLLLPDIDGFTILEKIRADKSLSKVPIIVFSNLSDEKDITRATRIGISEFMVKSNFTLDKLVDKIKSLIG